MKKLPFLVLVLFLSFACSQAAAEDPKPAGAKVILLISEQNIGGPQRAWWASEIDLSATEATLAKRLIEAGYEILEPSDLNDVIKQKRAFRVVKLSEASSIKLGNLSHADYVVLGTALVSSGGNVPQSNLRSCFANLSAKLIRVKDKKIIAYLDASGNSAHMDAITGGREALNNAAEQLAVKIIESLKK